MRAIQASRKKKKKKWGLGKPYIARNLFRDCKSAAIPEDDYAAVWFALADYILEKINSAQPEGVIVAEFGKFSRYQTGNKLWQPAPEFKEKLSCVGTSRAAQIVAKRVPYAEIAVDAQVTQTVVKKAISRMAQKLAAQARKGFRLNVSMGRLGVLWSRGRTCGFRFAKTKQNDLSAREAFVDITGEFANMTDTYDSYSHTEDHYASAASMQQSQSMSKQTKKKNSLKNFFKAFDLKQKQTKQSQYYSKQTSLKQTQKRSKKLRVISKQASHPDGYTQTVAKHAHSNLQHNQEQAQSELLDMVAALKVKLEKKYALEMKREVELRVSTQIKLLTEQHESRVGKQMLKMKADYEERLNGLTLMHQTLLDKALHESDSMKAQLMEFNTSNSHSKIANLKVKVKKQSEEILRLKNRISSSEERYRVDILKLQKEIQKAHEECPRCAQQSYQLIEAVRMKEEAELRVETFMQEKSTKLNQKVSRLNAQLSASALDYEKEVAALKAEARNRFTSLKLRLQEVTAKKEEYEALFPVLESEKVTLEQEVSRLTFDMRTLKAELTMLREQAKESCPNCAAMMEETRVESMRHQLAMEKVRSETQSLKVARVDMEQKWARMHKKHIEQQNKAHEERFYFLKKELSDL